MRTVWTAPAARDLEAIGDYIARDNRALRDEPFNASGHGYALLQPIP